MLFLRFLLASLHAQPSAHVSTWGRCAQARGLSAAWTFGALNEPAEETVSARLEQLRRAGWSTLRAC